MRPGRARQRAAAAALLCGAALAPGAQARCGADLAGAQRAESARYAIAYRSDPAKIAVSRHFALDIVVCPKADAPPARGLAVDARMPAHGHGMNYQAVVTPAGAGRFRAEGLLFHMPGRWELAFDVLGADSPERITHGVTLR